MLSLATQATKSPDAPKYTTRWQNKKEKRNEERRKQNSGQKRFESVKDFKRDERQKQVWKTTATLRRDTITDKEIREESSVFDSVVVGGGGGGGRWQSKDTYLKLLNISFVVYIS